MFDICENYKSYLTIDSLNIGYAKSSSVFFVIFPIITFIFNISVLIFYWLNRKNKKTSQVSMEKMLHILMLIELFISIYWTLNNVLYQKSADMYNPKDNCSGCFILSLIAVFLYTADWIFLAFTLHNLKTIINNPIDGILRPNARLNFYLVITFSSSVITTILSYMSKVYGRSPMITCFIRTEFINVEQIITVSFFLVIPFSFIIYSFYLAISLFINKKIRYDPRLSDLYYKYLIYILSYLLFNLPMIILYVITVTSKIEPDTKLSWFSFFSCVMSVISILVVSVLRIVYGYMKFDVLYICRKKKKKDTLISTDEFKWLEESVIKNFLRDILVGICFSLSHCKQNMQENEKYLRNSNQTLIPRLKKITKKECLETNDFNLNNNNLNFEDEVVNNSGMIEINFTEFAPEVFKQLRLNEELNENDIIESLKPMNNKLTIKESQGKSGNFFICTDDNKYILKTITPDELELIRSIYLKNFLNHLKIMENSLICRIYGLYKMTLTQGEDVLVILMRNVIGPFKNNILCKYDLKGSSLNRKTDFEIDSIEKIVMKDLNFEEIEKYILIGKQEVERLRICTKTDARFLNEMSIMDYSLFVVKISINKEEMELLSGIKNSTDNDIKNDLLKHYRKYIFTGLNDNIIYIISIIDYLQTYNFYKYLETNLKFYIKSRPDDIRAISCVPPEIYYERFVNFIQRITNIDIK